MNNNLGMEIVEILKNKGKGETEAENLSLTLHFFVFDMQRAIFDLVRLKHSGAASALLRVLFEAHIKAEWVRICATEEQLHQFKKDNVKSTIKPKNDITFGEMVSQLEEAKPQLNGALLEFKKDHWKGLNSFTHAGVLQLIQFSQNQEKKENLLNDAIDFSNRFAIASLCGVGKILQSEDVLSKGINLLEKHCAIKSI